MCIRDRYNVALLFAVSDGIQIEPPVTLVPVLLSLVKLIPLQLVLPAFLKVNNASPAAASMIDDVEVDLKT